VILWAKLSKTVKPSQALHLGLNGIEPKFQHLTMSWPAGCHHFRLGLRQGELESLPSYCTPLLFGAQWRFQGLPPLSFLLLRFHRLAFEPPRHTYDHSRDRAPLLVNWAGSSRGDDRPLLGSHLAGCLWRSGEQLKVCP